MNEELDELTAVAFQIILKAGDAKVAAEKALKALHQSDFALARACLEKADASLLEAHNAQTDLVQREAAGETFTCSLIFNHAQDTLMTSMTQLSLTREICSLYECLDRRIEALKS